MLARCSEERQENQGNPSQESAPSRKRRRFTRLSRQWWKKCKENNQAQDKEPVGLQHSGPTESPAETHSSPCSRKRKYDDSTRGKCILAYPVIQALLYIIKLRDSYKCYFF